MKVRIIEEFPKIPGKYARFIVQYRKWFVWKTYNYAVYNTNASEQRDRALFAAQAYLEKLKQELQYRRPSSQIISVEDVNDKNK